jgi:hypothetical protein
MGTGLGWVPAAAAFGNGSLANISKAMVAGLDVLVDERPKGSAEGFCATGLIEGMTEANAEGFAVAMGLTMLGRPKAIAAGLETGASKAIDMGLVMALGRGDGGFGSLEGCADFPGLLKSTLGCGIDFGLFTRLPGGLVPSEATDAVAEWFELVLGGMTAAASSNSI